MTFDFEKIQESKREMRRRLAALPVAEKLLILDQLRERAETLRTARPAPPTRRGRHSGSPGRKTGDRDSKTTRSPQEGATQIRPGGDE